ncbi:hypothetical protein J0A67_00415 [Algoriphagus aestuariicola]|uniref:Lipoprotein n=1 Tax=Algoriphagus aestuariicola TaxID=1852016 RepID=A0ABS3BJY5_9BACT|nr:hypothetical protein [Algoriphagus aestuariicola]MBN7799297.1 hypothetical protein [Algoriphagus aestuariicola]
MKNSLVLFSILALLWSCTEEVSRDINTDLTQEAEQFYRFSEAIGEASYLANISQSEYSSILSQELPGCPSITHSLDSLIITLDYSSDEVCEQENKIPRTGKIILDFTLSDSANSLWSLSYEDYTYRGGKIEGQRNFEGVSPEESQEIFENLRIELANGIGFTADGELSYVISSEELKPSSITSRGKITGMNPAGRDFSIVTSTAKVQLFQCYGQGWDLPQSGEELWMVSRGGTAELEYEVTFQNTETCNPIVTSSLPDGRTFQLNP